MICLYDAKEQNFDNNGLTVLIPTACTVTEELNGSYELELTHPLDDLGRWRYLEPFAVIKAPTPRHGYQLFRIYQPGKFMEDGIRIHARQVFYDLIYNYVFRCEIANLSAETALRRVLDVMEYKTSHTVAASLNKTANAVFENKNPVAIIMDGEESLLSIYGGELERDNFSFSIREGLGSDNGVTIRYGKNLTGLEFTENVENVMTRIIPYRENRDGNIYLPERYIDSPNIGRYPFPLVQDIEFTDLEGDLITAMRQRVQDMYNDGMDLPEINVKVSFIELEKTEQYKEYKVLEHVSLGDIVTVIHPGLMVDIRAKCIKYGFNCLTERYEYLELGQPKASLTEAVMETDRRITKVSGVDLMAQGIAHNMGGHVVKRYDELLIMDSPDVGAAKNIWKWDKTGLSYSRDGYNGVWYPKFKMDGSEENIPNA